MGSIIFEREKTEEKPDRYGIFTKLDEKRGERIIGRCSSVVAQTINHTAHTPSISSYKTPKAEICYNM